MNYFKRKAMRSQIDVLFFVSKSIYYIKIKLTINFDFKNYFFLFSSIISYKTKNYRINIKSASFLH
jgi:hypothetical protein